MAADLQGLKKRLNKGMADPDLQEALKGRGKGLIQDAINDFIVDAIKSSGLEQWVAEQVADAAESVGFSLKLNNIADKEQTRTDVDAAVTAKINQLAGTSFSSLRLINRDAISNEVGRLAGEKLGLGPLFPVANFREAMGNQLVSAFEGSGGGQVAALFGPQIIAAIEENVVAGWKELTTKSVEAGNPSARFGAPRDAAHAAKRAAGRKRQAKYRAKNYLHWVESASNPATSTGNGREGLTGKASGNVKAVRWDQSMYQSTRDK
jgi:hypothetical protein